MNNSFELQAQTRRTFGKAAARRLRREKELIPATICGAHKETEHFVIFHNTIKLALQNEAFYSHILTIDIEGKKQKAVLKKVQRHPSKPKILHLDFQRVSAKEKITMSIPIHFKGGEKAPGVKEDEGVLFHNLSEIEIRCLPSHLPEFIELDVSQLKLNEAIHLSELKLPEGVELTAFINVENPEEHDQVVASIHIPKEEPEPEPEPEETAEGEEGEEGVKGEEAGGDEEGEKSTEGEQKEDAKESKDEKEGKEHGHHHKGDKDKKE